MRRSIQPGTHRSAPSGQLINALERSLDHRNGVANLDRIARPFLSDSQRHGVLQMRAADLDDVVPPLGLFLNGGGKSFDSGQEVPLYFEDTGDMHCCREGVV